MDSTMKGKGKNISIENEFDSESNSFDKNDEMFEDEVAVVREQVGDGEKGRKIKKVKVEVAKGSRTTSNVWDIFEKTKVEDKGVMVTKAKCMYCKKFYSYKQGSSTSHLLRHMKKCVVYLRNLAKKHDQALLNYAPSEAGNSSEPNVEQASDYYRFGWLLFLVLRIQTFSRFKDLVTSTDGLVSVLAILIIHISVRLRNFNIQDSSSFAKKSEKGVNIIASLCEKYHTSEDELSIALEKTNTLIMDILKRNGYSKKDPALLLQNVANSGGDTVSYFEWV